MIKAIYNFEVKQVTGGCEYGMNCTTFAVGDNITFKENACFRDFDNNCIKNNDGTPRPSATSWLRQPGVTCIVKQVGSKNYSQRNNQLLLGACFRNGVAEGSNIASWIPENEVNKV